MSLMDLLTVVNSDPKTTLDDMIFRSIVYTTMNDLRTYGDTSYFFEALSIDDRSKLYKREDFINCESLYEILMRQVFRDNRQIDLEKSLHLSKLKAFIDNDYTFINDNGFIGRLVNLCAKMDGVDLSITNDSYTVTDLLNDDMVFSLLCSYFTPGSTNRSLSIAFEEMIKKNISSFYSKMESLGAISVVQSPTVSSGWATCNYDGCGYLLGTKIVWSGSGNYFSGWTTTLTLDSNNISSGDYVGKRFESNVTLSTRVGGYTGAAPNYYGIMYILPKDI